MSDEQNRVRSWLKAHRSWLSELQSRFPGCIGQSLYAPVIDVSAAVEYDLGHTLRLRALGNGFTHGLGGGDISTAAPLLTFAFRGACGNQRLSAQVIDHLHVNVIQRAVNIQPRAVRCPLHLLTDAIVAKSAFLVLRDFRQHDKSSQLLALSRRSQLAFLKPDA